MFVKLTMSRRLDPLYQHCFHRSAAVTTAMLPNANQEIDEEPSTDLTSYKGGTNKCTHLEATPFPCTTKNFTLSNATFNIFLSVNFWP